MVIIFNQFKKSDRLKSNNRHELLKSDGLQCGPVFYDVFAFIDESGYPGDYLLPDPNKNISKGDNYEPRRNFKRTTKQS